MSNRRRYILVIHTLISLLNSWYTIELVENRRVVRTRRNHVVKDIDIVRYDGKGASEIYMKTTDGLSVLHRRRDFCIPLSRRPADLS